MSKQIRLPDVSWVCGDKDCTERESFGPDDMFLGSDGVWRCCYCSKLEGSRLSEIVPNSHRLAPAAERDRLKALVGDLVEAIEALFFDYSQGSKGWEAIEKVYNKAKGEL